MSKLGETLPPMASLKKNFADSKDLLRAARVQYIESAFVYALVHLRSPKSEKPKAAMKTVIFENMAQLTKEADVNPDEAAPDLSEADIQPAILEAARGYL